MFRARDFAQSIMPLAVLLAMAGGTPAAAAIGDLYQAQAIVTGQGTVTDACEHVGNGIGHHGITSSP